MLSIPDARMQADFERFIGTTHAINLWLLCDVLVKFCFPLPRTEKTLTALQNGCHLFSPIRVMIFSMSATWHKQIHFV